MIIITTDHARRLDRNERIISAHGIQTQRIGDRLLADETTRTASDPHRWIDVSSWCRAEVYVWLGYDADAIPR